jgi:hypothetical protein
MDVAAFLAACAIGTGLAHWKIASTPTVGVDPSSGVDHALLHKLAKYRGLYGTAIRSHFALDFTFVHLNHGSYGTAPKAVMRAAADEMLA